MHVSGDYRSLHAASAKPEVAHKVCGMKGGGWKVVCLTVI